MLAIDHLTVEYPGGIQVIDGFSINIEAGQSVALIGANGAGKTTLLLALVGVLPAVQGEIRLSQTVLDKHSLREMRARIGLVFQDPDDQLFMPSIHDDVAFGLQRQGLPVDKTEARVSETLASLGIGRLAGRSPLQLSGGEKRLAAIATVLALEPELLLFDEPTAFLDPKARRDLAALLATLPQAKLIATHDLAFAEASCSRVLLLQEGRLVADGPAAELLHDAALLEAAGL